MPPAIKSWDVTQSLKAEIDLFKQNMPIIRLLRDPAMRDRHWANIKVLVKDQFDQHSEYFILDKFMELGFHKYHSEIKTEWETAQAEFKIESTLRSIEDRWGVTELGIELYKDGKIKLVRPKSADQINDFLEEDMLLLASMKTNFYYAAFAKEIEGWDNSLSKMIETIEILMLVQKQFIYFNNIFENIQEEIGQLIGDLNNFKRVKNQWELYLNKIAENKNAKLNLTIDHFKESLYSMSGDLDMIQRNMKKYLDKRRTDFARFYFLSDPDMFEILGKAREPTVINKHLKKMFEGIKSLHYQEHPGQKKDMPKTYSFTKMISPEGEDVEFGSDIDVDGDIIKMMRNIENAMKEKLGKSLAESLQFIEQSHTMKPQDRYEKWLKEYPGQIILTTAQLRWTTNCTVAITNIVNQQDKTDKDKGAEKDGKAKRNPQREYWNQKRNDSNRQLEDITKLVRKATSDLVKLNIIALITIEVRHRELIDHLSINCSSLSSFEWLRLLRFQKIEKASDSVDVNVMQGYATFPYGFEYQGCNGRLVLTNLTDRCYITLTTAMYLRKGGAPQGPAGTGKTETVKDLGKHMARFVFVFNCSDGLDVMALRNMLEGFAQTGSWGCFDEFNRIDIGVLSVVAIQITTILDAIATISDDKRTFEFEDKEIPLDRNCALFITMNPGYAGRTELPDNLKALFRPISMMQPDYVVICKITLQAEGFKSAEALAKKIESLYSLMVRQFSHQAHYDFALRAIKSVLNLAGQIRREKQQTEKKTKQELSADDEATLEQSILIKAILDSNDPKLVGEDAQLFEA